MQHRTRDTMSDVTDEQTIVDTSLCCADSQRRDQHQPCTRNRLPPAAVGLLRSPAGPGPVSSERLQADTQDTLALDRPAPLRLFITLAPHINI